MKLEQLEEAGIISQSMTDWASTILVMPKKQDCIETNKSQGSSNFNLQLWSWLQEAEAVMYPNRTCQIKTVGSLGKVISNYPLPNINSILAGFNGCRYI